MKASIMVIGGSGFAGSHVTYMLAERGDDVLLFDLRPPSGYAKWLMEPVKDRIKFVKGDFTDLSSVIACLRNHTVEKIIQVACIRKKYAPTPYLEMKLNVEATLNVLESARLMDVEKVAFFSSIGVYGPVLGGVADEDVPRPYPLTPYGSYKVACECIGLNYDAIYGITFIALRPCAIYGSPGDGDTTRFFKIAVDNAIMGKPVRFESGGDVLRDFVHVKDVASAALLAVDAERSKLEHRIFNVAWGEPRPQREFIEILKELLPDSKIEMGPGIGPKGDSGLEYANILSQRWIIKRARKELGWQPKYDLRKGIKDYIESYRGYLMSTPHEHH